MLTKHAIRRFRRRIDRRATVAEIQAELDAGEFHQGLTGYDMARRYDQAGYVVTGRAIFPVQPGTGLLVAKSCFRPRRRRSKADRRAWREQQREDTVG